MATLRDSGHCRCMGRGSGSGLGRGGPARRTVRTGAALLLGSVAVALLLARHYHQNVAAILVSAILGVPGLFFTYAAYRDDRRAEQAAADQDAVEEVLSRLADRLAAVVRAQWLTEAVARGLLNNPYPLSVSWEPADPLLVDRWSTLTTLVNSGGWPKADSAWASGPSELAGRGSELADVLARVPTGRLVVLGEPGSGKTVLVLRLVLDLLERRRSGDPVPVLVSASSWNPTVSGVYDWLASQLALSYPPLAVTASTVSVSRRFRALIDSGLIVPVLDGLDEIPYPARVSAVAKLNAAMRPGDRLVVTCRRPDFLTAIAPPGGLRVPLRGAAGIELCSLDSGTVTSYLYADAAQDQDSPWQPALAGLPAGAPLAAALSSPLLLTLARAIYNTPPAESGGSAPDPSELCSLPDRAAIEDRLLSAFVTAAYRSTDTGSRSRRPWRASRAERWLGFLADHLESDIGKPDFAWWQLAKPVPRMVVAVAAGLITGAAAALAVEVSLVVFAVAARAYRLHVRTISVPAVSAAALRGAQLAPLVFAVSGLVTALAFTLSGAGRGHLPSGPLWRALPLGAGSAVVGLLIGAVTWHYVTPPWIAAAFGAAGAGLVAVAARYAQRTGRGQDLRRGACAGLVVGGMTALVFGVVHAALREDANQWLAWARTWLLLAGLPAAMGAARRSGRGDQPAMGAHWRARKGVRGALAAGAVAALIGSFISRSAFGLPLSVLGVTFAVAGGAAFGMERIPGDTTEAVGPAAVLARDRRAALLLTLVAGAAAAVLTGVAVTSWDASYHFPDTGHLIALEDGLSMAAGTGVAVTVGLAVAGLGLAWPGLASVADSPRLASAPWPPAVPADGVPRRRAQARRSPPGWSLLPVPAHRTAASPRRSLPARRVRAQTASAGSRRRMAQAEALPVEAARAGEITPPEEKDQGPVESQAGTGAPSGARIPNRQAKSDDQLVHRPGQRQRPHACSTASSARPLP